MSENGCLKDGIFHNLQVTGQFYQNNATRSIKLPGGEVHSRGSPNVGVSGLDNRQSSHSETDVHDKTGQEIAIGLNYYNFETDGFAEHIPLFVYNQAQAQTPEEVQVTVDTTDSPYTIELPNFPTAYVLYDKLYVDENKKTSLSQNVFWDNFFLQADKICTFHVAFQFAIPQITSLDTLTFGIRRVTGYTQSEASKLQHGTLYRYPDFPGANVSGYRDYYGIQIQPNSLSNSHADLEIHWNDDDTRGGAGDNIGLSINSDLFSNSNSTWRFDFEFSTTGQSGNILEVKNIKLTNMKTYIGSEILPSNAKKSIVLNNENLQSGRELALSHVYFSPFIWYKPANNQGDPSTSLSLGIKKIKHTQSRLNVHV